MQTQLTMDSRDETYALIAKRVSEYKNRVTNINTADLDDLSTSLSQVFLIEKSEVKLIIDEVLASEPDSSSNKDILLDKAIKHSKDIILLIIFAFIASLII